MAVATQLPTSMRDVESATFVKWSIPPNAATNSNSAMMDSSDERMLSKHKIEMPDESLICAICFEEVDHTTRLPCNCNVTYCSQCWDRSLAQSFNSSGEARCPTCRGPVCVDFDSDRLSLVFSRAVPPPPPSVDYDRRIQREASKAEAVKKLREQAKPAQMRLLQKHGARHPGLMEISRSGESVIRKMSVSDLKRHIRAVGASSDDCLEKEDLVARLLEESKKKQMMGRVLGEQIAALTEELPECVCGSALIRVSGMERTMRCCDKMPQLSGIPRGSYHYQALFDRFSSQTSICFCDLCSSSVPTANAVWTCKSGDTTILHANSYDVCDECFMRHTADGHFLRTFEDCATGDVEMTSML